MGYSVPDQPKPDDWSGPSGCIDMSLFAHPQVAMDAQFFHTMFLESIQGFTDGQKIKALSMAVSKLSAIVNHLSLRIDDLESRIFPFQN